VIVDVNVLLYAATSESVHHDSCKLWLQTALNGDSRVGLPWPSLLSFLRISTHPRVMTNHLTTAHAWDFIDEWLAQPIAWIPAETPHHVSILKNLTTSHHLSGNQIPDAHLAALAIGHGVPVVSCDNDFGRFTEVNWINPITAN
jgi:toxin-antitoxin system PIN domain toxin